MTVTYTAEIATCRKFGCFIKLLARWRGSIYKLIWMDLLLFLTLYYSINLIYIYLLNTDSKKTFESIVYYCASYTAMIPLSFVLGFYVNLVMTRWWEQYTTIPWPDSIAVFVSAHFQGQDEGSRVMRRTVMRYVCVCLTIVFSMISPCVKKRFPKLKNLVEAGLLLENEREIIESMDTAFPKYPKHWMPIVWAASIITRARKENRIRDDFAVKTIIDELNTFRGRCGFLMYYDCISIPLVYTQVVTIAVYSFFVCSLLAHQWTEMKKDTYEGLDFYLPIFITLQFFFYMGWLKVAETLINPFGEDDDDFEVNWMIDRNLQVSYLIVDEMHHEHPELVKDQYWDEVYPNELPYEAEIKREEPPEPSTAKYDLDIKAGRSSSKLASQNSSFTATDKPRFSIPNILSLQSQRFNEAFQRFSTLTEEDASSISKIDIEASVSSIADENLQHITSYESTERDSDIESQMRHTGTWVRSTLETVAEEGEETYEEEKETEEEELLMNEEEAATVEIQSSYESDSDSDTFEQLRVERLQQRYRRMNDYLQRNFGSNFRITTPPISSMEKSSKRRNKEEQSMVESSDTLKDEVTLCPTCSSTPIKEEEGSMGPIESNLRILLETMSLTKIKSELEGIQDYSEVAPTTSRSKMLWETSLSPVAECSVDTEERLVSKNISIGTSPMIRTKSIGTSPMGSATTGLTEPTSETDEWEFLSTYQTTSAEELTRDIEDNEEEEVKPKSD